MPTVPRDPLTLTTLDTLVRHGIVPAAEREDLDVSPLHQRSLCYRVQRPDGVSVFVKRATRDAAQRWSADLPREASRLARALRYPVAAPALLTTVVEEDLQLIVTEFLDGYVGLGQARRADGGSSPRLAAALGELLGRLHAVRPEPGEHDDTPNHARQVVDSWLVITPARLAALPAGYAEMARAVRRGRLTEPLMAAAAGWRQEAFVHADLKSDNVLCADPGSSGDVAPSLPAVRLVDWELAGWGDPAWDVGSVLGDYLFSWLASMRFTADGGLGEWTASAQPPLVDVRVELRSFLAAYRPSAVITQDEGRTWLAYAAIFLLQRLAAGAVQSPALPAVLLACLQVAGQLLNRPDDCWEILL